MSPNLHGFGGVVEAEADMAGADPDLSMRGWGTFNLGKDLTLVVRLQHLAGLLRLSNRYTDSDLLLFLLCQEQP